MNKSLRGRKVKKWYELVNKNTLAGIVILLVVAVDQLSKNIQSQFTTICNSGIAFGIKTNATLLVLIVLSLVLWIYLKEKKTISTLGFSLIFAGGISNLVDRVTFGCVRDFIAIFIFPAFNFADFAITLGAVIIALNIIILRSET